MSNTFQLIDIILLLGISQGLFLSVTLQFISNTNRKANIILSVILLLAMTMLIGRFLYVRHLSYVIFQWSLVVDSIVFLFGPLLYLYIKRFLFKSEKNKFLPFYHFIPFFALLTLSLYFVFAYTPEGYYRFFIEKNIMKLFNIIAFCMIVFNSVYIVFSFLLVKKFKKAEKQTLSFDQNPLIYLYSFLIAFSLCIVAWLFSYINSTFLDSYFTYLSNDSIWVANYDSVWVAIPLFIYVIGYFSLKQPELFRIPFEEKPKEKKDRLSEQESMILKEKMDSLMINEKLFLRNDLTLVDAADILKTSTNNVSWLLNNVYNSTFYDFINEYRVKEFVFKIQNKEHLNRTILALSMDVGFNSKSTFNKAFKLNMKDTPSNYIKKYRAA